MCECNRVCLVILHSCYTSAMNRRHITYTYKYIHTYIHTYSTLLYISKQYFSMYIHIYLYVGESDKM